MHRQYLSFNLIHLDVLTSHNANPRAVKRCECGGAESKCRLQPRWLSGGHIPLTSREYSIFEEFALGVILKRSKLLL